MIPSILRLGGGQDITLEGTGGDISLDGGKFYPDKDDPDTYISQSAADKLEITVGNATMMAFVEDTTDKITLSNAADFYIDDGKLFFAADDADTYMISSAADTLSVYVGGVEMIKCTESTTDDVTVLGTLYVQDQIIGVPLSSLVVHDNTAALLPVAAANDDCGLICGTFGTTAPSIQTADEGGTGSEQNHYARFMFTLPPTYKAGQTVKIKCHGGMLRVADQAATTVIDCEAFATDITNGDLSMSADLCTTDPITAINSTTFAEHSFTINDAATGTAFGPGTQVDVRLRLCVDDNGNAGDDITMVVDRINVVIEA